MGPLVDLSGKKWAHTVSTLRALWVLCGGGPWAHRGAVQQAHARIRIQACHAAVEQSNAKRDVLVRC